MSAPVRHETPTRAYSYIRYSTLQQQSGASQQRQTEKAAKYALDHGLELDTERNMSDLGVSAFRGKNARTGALRRFLDDVEKGYVPKGSYLLIENMDRMSRDDIITSQGLFSLIISSGINVVTLTDQELYTLERFKREPEAMYRITAELIRANRESTRKSQLIGDAKARKKKRLIEGSLAGEPYTRQTPAWITWSQEERQYTLIDERAAIVREIFESADAGMGVDRIARSLNERRVPTWNGKGRRKTADHWRNSYIRKVLTSTAPIGTFTPHTTKHDETTRARYDEPVALVENLFPAAVDAETYWRVNRKLSTKAPRGRNARRPAKSITAGITFCATCGRAVTRVTKQSTRGHYIYLVCSRANMKAEGCDYRAVRYDAVEKALRHNARTLIKEAPRGKSAAALDKQIYVLQANANEAEHLMFEAAEAYAHERTPALRRVLSDSEKELKDIQKQLRDLRAQRDTLTTASVKDRLKEAERVLTHDAGVIETNRVLRDAIRRIVLDPEQGRLWIRWHHSEETQAVLCVTRHMDWTDMREIKAPLHALFPEKHGQIEGQQQQ
jgi:DNA invertase Pin-like site-specific DNA recombinase